MCTVELPSGGVLEVYRDPTTMHLFGIDQCYVEDEGPSVKDPYGSGDTLVLDEDGEQAYYVVEE